MILFGELCYALTELSITRIDEKSVKGIKVDAKADIEAVESASLVIQAQGKGSSIRSVIKEA